MESVRKSSKALWTTVTVTVNGSAEALAGAEAAVRDFFRDVREFEARFSRFLPDSEVSFANRSAGKPLKVTEGFMELWNLSENVRRDTGGFFDARIEPLLSNWGYRSDPAFSIGRDEILGERFEPKEAAFPFRTDFRIDFWGIGKGFVLDMAESRFERFENVCVVAGGDVFVKGRHVSGNPFSIALEHPLDPTLAIGEIRFPDRGFVAGSSANRRSWGNGRAHIANPLSGKPATEMLATFVHSRKWYLADAWATAFFAMGFELAKERANGAEGVECLLVSTDGTVFKSKGFLWKTFA